MGSNGGKRRYEQINRLLRSKRANNIPKFHSPSLSRPIGADASNRLPIYINFRENSEKGDEGICRGLRKENLTRGYLCNDDAQRSLCCSRIVEEGEGGERGDMKTGKHTGVFPCDRREISGHGFRITMKYTISDYSHSPCRF